MKFDRKYFDKHKNVILASAISAVSLVLVLVITISTVMKSMGTVMKNGDLMEGFSTKRASCSSFKDDFKAGYSNFAFNLVSEISNSKSNVAFSVSNVAGAMALMASGAEGKTKTQIEDMLGGDVFSFRKQISGLEKNNAYSEKSGSGIKSSNNLWLNNTTLYKIKNSFLKTNGKYFGLNIVREDLGDFGAAENLQKNITDGTSNSVFASINMNASQQMYIASGATFVANWKTQASAEDTQKSLFTGTEASAEAEFFKTLEDGYISGDTFEGIVKEYDNGCSFVALLPAEFGSGTYYSVSDVVNELKSDGEKFTNLLSLKKVKSETAVLLPNYSNSVNSATTCELNSALKNMGAKLIFDSSANMKSMAENCSNLCLGNITASGDITVLAAGSSSDISKGEKISDKKWNSASKRIAFDRSFVYFIVDNKSELPIYCGILNEIY